MLCPQYFFYIVYNPEGLLYFDFSSNIQVDYTYFESRYKNISFEMLNIHLTIGQADFLRASLLVSISLITNRLKLLIFRILRLSLNSTVKLYKKLVNKALGKMRITNVTDNIWVNNSEHFDRGLEVFYHQHKDKLLEILGGRILFRNEMLAALTQYNTSNIYLDKNLNGILQLNAIQGNGEILPSIRTMPDGNLTCLRCGQSHRVKQIFCSICGREDCHYCEECASMGEARSCNPLYTFKSVEKAATIHRETKVVFPGRLTLAQEDAAKQLKDFVMNEYSKTKEALVWAACGAGKTEVSFESIRTVLDMGGRVLFAIPRRDVVLELEPRLQKAFPETEIVTLYGGAKDKYKKAPLTIATTHQVIRFCQSFDLIILDEMDAFPYQGSEMLKFAVQRAKKPDGRIVFMTATPSSKYIKELNQGKGKVIKIPARHHRFPLPVPQTKIGKLLEGSESYLEILSFIRESVRDGAPVFVFVPTIASAEKIAQELGVKLKDDGIKVDYSHSKDPLRDSKKERFSKGEFQVFVTTTIMERGITIPRANVLIAFADAENIFNDQSLIQMAGRAGRTTNFPTGKVLFVGARLTESMREAVEKIKLLNKEAFEKGYVDVENIS